MRKLIKLYESDDIDKDLNLTAKKIQEGFMVVFPTETVYGLGTNGLNSYAVKKIFDVKKRSLNKPVSLLVSDINMIKTIALNVSDLEWKLIECFFPGPLTIVLTKQKCVPDILTANNPTVGVRMPDDNIALNLIKKAGIPIATTSANISDEASSLSIEEAINQFGDDVDYYLDNGKSKIGIASTVIKVENNKVRILRQGSITKEEIEKICEVY